MADTYPAATDVRTGVQYGPNDTDFTGTCAVPAAADVLGGVAVDATTGTYVVVVAANVRSGTTFGAASAETGTCTVPAAASVLAGTPVDATTGTYSPVVVTDVRAGVAFGAASAEAGTCSVPTAAQVLDGVAVDASSGTVVLPTAAQVLVGVGFGAGSASTGTVTLPGVGDVRDGETFGASLASTGTLELPTEAQVEDGVGFGTDGTEFTGELEAGAGGGGYVTMGEITISTPTTRSTVSGNGVSQALPTDTRGASKIIIGVGSGTIYFRFDGGNATTSDFAWTSDFPPLKINGNLADVRWNGTTGTTMITQHYA